MPFKIADFFLYRSQPQPPVEPVVEKKEEEPKPAPKIDVVEPKPVKKIDDSHGRIEIALQYISKQQKLVVGIIRCSGLKPMDLNGMADPYVKW